MEFKRSPHHTQLTGSSLVQTMKQTFLAMFLLTFLLPESSSQLTGSGGIFLLPEGEEYRDRETLEASRKAVRLAMELDNKVEPFETVVEHAVDGLETVHSGNSIPPVFSISKSLYASIRRGRVPKKIHLIKL